MNKREIDRTIKKLIQGVTVYNDRSEPFSAKDYWSGAVFEALDTLPTLDSFTVRRYDDKGNYQGYL